MPCKLLSGLAEQNTALQAVLHAACRPASYSARPSTKLQAMLSAVQVTP